VNKLAGHMGELAFESEALAREADPADGRAKSTRYVSLDGMWRFAWQRTTVAIPQNISEAVQAVKRWRPVMLPSNLEYPNLPPGAHPSDVYAFPIYTNDKYPFKTRHHGTWGQVIDDRLNPSA
jgi:beta-galactosidase/beta-glucuronidase